MGDIEKTDISQFDIGLPINEDRKTAFRVKEKTTGNFFVMKVYKFMDSRDKRAKEEILNINK